MVELDLGKVVMDSYADLKNKPKINDVVLEGEKTLDELGIASKEALEKTDSKVNIIIEQAELRFKETASGENIHLDDSADSKFVEFAMYGKARQDGTPTPENPVDIVVAGESYNLLRYPYHETTKTVNGITFTDNGDGTITANGTATSNTTFTMQFRGGDFSLSEGNYILSGCPAGGGTSTYRIGVNHLVDGSAATIGYDNGSGFEFSNTDKDLIGVFIYATSGVKVENLIFKPMLRKASITNDRYMPYGKGIVEVKSCGSQLFRVDDVEIGKAWNNANNTARAIGVVECRPNATYTISCDSTAFDGVYCFQKANKTDTVSVVDNVRIENKITITANEKTNFIVIQFNKDGISKVDIENAKVMVNEGMAALSYEPYKETTATIPTPNGLSGIPVDSGGNYTDSNGQQWICDEIVKYADGSGEYVKRIEKKVFDGLNNVCTWVSSSVNNGTLRQINLGNKASMPNSVFINSKYILCDKFKPFKFNNVNDNFAYGCRQGSTSSICCLLKESDGVTDIQTANTWLQENHVTVYYIIEPIRTTLTAEQLAEIEKLHTFYPVTNISNDADCGMKVKYIADAKSYIDNRLALIEQAMLNSI
jgi:hypothetical protein